jgi:hypothetical protein
MPAAGNISISDSVPVARVFNPVNVNKNGVDSYENRASGIYIGYDRLSIGITRPGQSGPKSARNLQTKVRLVVPTLETLSGSTLSGIIAAPSLAYACVLEMTAWMPERSTYLDRNNAFTLFRQALANATTNSAVLNGEGAY